MSWGWTATIWLAHIVSQGDHRKLTVRDWVRQAHSTLEQVTGLEIRETDFTDDRLTIVLRYLSDPTRWQAIEQELGQHLVRVYELEEQPIRVDATTVSGYRNGGEDSLWQFGHSKDDPTLRQIKAMMATLDPLALEVVSGEQADDPLYVPIIDRVLACLGRQGLLFVGDCKMSALATRAHLVAQQQYYLTPLAQVGETAELLPTWIEAGVKQGEGLIAVVSEDGEQVLAQGYELSRMCVSGELSWQERVLVVRSLAYADTQHRHLEERLAKAQAALLSLTPAVGRGKRQISEEAALQSAVEAVLTKHRVTGLLTYRFERQVEQELKFVGRGRGGTNRPQQMRERVRYQITAVERNQEAIAQLVSTLGWRAYATNAPQKRLSLEQAVRDYRHEYHIEHGFGRLKGAPLSIAPLFVKRDDQVIGLTQRLECGLTGAEPHGVCGAPFVEAAAHHPARSLQGQPTQSYRHADGGTPLAGLCASHPHPGAVARAGYLSCDPSDPSATADPRVVGTPCRSLYLPDSANSTNYFSFTRMMSLLHSFIAFL